MRSSLRMGAIKLPAYLEVEQGQTKLNPSRVHSSQQVFFSPDDIAARWGCCSNTVRTLIRSGDLAGFKIGKRRYAVTAEVLENYEGPRNSMNFARQKAN